MVDTYDDLTCTLKLTGNSQFNLAHGAKLRSDRKLKKERKVR